MKEMARYGLILAFICVVAAGLLATVNTLTGPKIIAAAQSEEQAALKEVMPLAVKFTAVKPPAAEEILYYKAFDAQGKLIGFVFKASGKGYSSVIETLAGIFPDGKISAIKVISLNETPGLGMRVTEDKFTAQFNRQSSLDLSGVQAITGATISSRAVMNSVMKKAHEIKELIKNDPFDFAQGHAERTEGKSKHDK
ncbi:MAG: FMN-binding protein [Candidatus Omnitrophica bacterium]|nr:FMN-binding protein [Candidatus Omnitrophota bacterium]MBU4302768.1 FMN-binding protein [Candidatus Omnitrophota bacterium]MBU4418783.1 FMN-binding protein [Candidatus Omnitrophota bacterium]MBU4467544.1 FMN-binding protein [Candidatus Omnitrophota bacterium]MCG2707406.1 FMN-binding protein [Candidatus Omnitrophota bacterium]